MPMVNSKNSTWSGSVLNDLITFMANLKATVAQAKVRRTKYRETYAELSVLSDRDLSDIGIARCDIKRLAIEESLKGACS